MVHKSSAVFANLTNSVEYIKAVADRAFISRKK